MILNKVKVLSIHVAVFIISHIYFHSILETKVKLFKLYQIQTKKIQILRRVKSQVCDDNNSINKQGCHRLYERARAMLGSAALA